MNRFMRKFRKSFRYGEKGFTLIELLIVVAILGILAALVVPNVVGYMTSGRLNAANTEVANVKTAAVGYKAENEVWPTSAIPELDAYLSGQPKMDYTFSSTTGLITGPTTDADWPGLTFVPATQTWERASP